MVRQPLDELDYRAGLDDGDARLALHLVLEHDVLLRVLHGEAVHIRRGQPQRVRPLLVLQHGVQHAVQGGAVLQGDQRRHPRSLLLGCASAEHRAVLVLAQQLEGVPQLRQVLAVHDAHLPQHELLLQPVLGAGARAGQPRALVGLAADHQAVEQEVVALVFGAGAQQRALQDELAAALADVFALPAVDALLDLVHALDGQVLAADLPAVQAAQRLAAGTETGAVSTEPCRKPLHQYQNPLRSGSL